MAEQPYYVLGMEGSANKIGVGIVDQTGRIWANPRETFITPPGTGFQPRETARHHQLHVLPLVQRALQEAHLEPRHISAIAFTKVPPFFFFFFGFFVLSLSPP